MLAKTNVDSPIESKTPKCNRCVIFTNYFFPYNDHPDPIKYSVDRSRKSIALHYNSIGRPEFGKKQSIMDLFLSRPKVKFTTYKNWNASVYDLT